MNPATKRRIAFGVLAGLLLAGIGMLIFGFVCMWQQRGAAMAIGTFSAFALAVVLPFWISAWAHAEDDS